MAKIALLFGTLLLISANSLAAPLTFGAYTEGGLWGGDATDGGFGSTSAYVVGSDSTSPWGQGTYQAEAIFDGTTYTPILRAQSSLANPAGSDPNYQGNAFALQTFTYSGPSTTITLDLSLHGVVVDSPTDPANPYIRSRLNVFGGTLEVVPYSTGNYCFNGIYSQGFESYICGTDLGSSNLWITDGEDTVTDSVSFAVNNGSKFMIHADLTALSFGGSADAWNTFSIAVSGLNGGTLSAASANAIPVPAAAWLFISGLLGLIGISRKNK